MTYDSKVSQEEQKQYTYENEDTLSFTVTDDLSGLTHLRISAAGRKEQRE